ncbi:MAG: hypothetical protein Q4G62_10980, partial [Pseudomonadota bacterium]|nr:hypothetical protein [Pseudomonadota bacterium]
MKQADSRQSINMCEQLLAGYRLLLAAKRLVLPWLADQAPRWFSPQLTAEAHFSIVTPAQTGGHFAFTAQDQDRPQ